MQTTSRHAVERAYNRVGREMPEDIENIISKAERYAQNTKMNESVAVCIARTRMVGAAWSNSSNGDMLIAIIRQRTIVTLMFRRRSQPFDALCLSVHRVASIA